MPAAQSTARRSTVDVDTRRSVFMLAAGRKPRDVAEENHENFVRRALKDKLGWPRREPAPQAIKDAAKAIAAQLLGRDKQRAEAEAARVAKAAAVKAESEALGERIVDVLEARETV